MCTHDIKIKCIECPVFECYDCEIKKCENGDCRAVYCNNCVNKNKNLFYDIIQVGYFNQYPIFKKKFDEETYKKIILPRKKSLCEYCLRKLKWKCGSCSSNYSSTKLYSKNCSNCIKPICGSCEMNKENYYECNYCDNKFCFQCYDNDREIEDIYGKIWCGCPEVLTAAIIIQKAFRKYRYIPKYKFCEKVLENNLKEIGAL